MHPVKSTRFADRFVRYSVKISKKTFAGLNESMKSHGMQAIIFPTSLVIFLGSCAQDVRQEVRKTSILEIRADPLKYENKIVQITAWVRSGPYDISLESDDFEQRIAIVNADWEGVRLPPQLRVMRNELYDQFWEHTKHDELPDTGAHGLRVELDGCVRLLKKDGKLADDFELYGQRPIEIIPIKIIKMQVYP